MSSEMWRFPDNRYAQENGLDTSDMETFKKDSDGGLAREICQNSIDANNGDSPTKVEFKLFQIERSKIPGIDELTKAIEDCYEYKKNDDKESRQLLNMKNTINSDIIKCLRISDFNTKGLQGVETNKRGTPFFNLTKGSGTSNKGSGKGGSKGIGKFATFVASTTNTVFYSTRTIDEEVGYIGITKLRSIPYEQDDKLMTQGIGYFCGDDKQSPILGNLELDAEFHRDDNDFGTDIYLIGFNDTNDWRTNIIYKILESFMAAFLFEGFEVNVGGVIINKDNLKEIIFESSLLSKRKQREIIGVQAQYELLTAEDTEIKDFIIGESSKITLYVKSYASKNEGKASKRCELIRYPYMKIREYRKQSFLPYSAICIIHDNYLNERLRDIENPEHTEWQMDRLKNDHYERKITKGLYDELFKVISEYINEILKLNTGDSTDVEGASKYLPSFNGEGLDEDNVVVRDKVSITPIKKNEANNPKTAKVGENGNGLGFSTGDLGGYEDGIKQPREKTTKPSLPNPWEKREPDDNDQGSSSGKKSILKKVPLSGIRYKNIMKKEVGNYDIVFTSAYDEDNCELSINQLGESNDKYNINIINAKINGIDSPVENGIIKNIKIRKGVKYIISYAIEEKERFAIEVILNAYR